MGEDSLESRITAMRGFNRFYTRHVGALNEGLLKSPFSLTECRVLYELAHCETITASGLARDLRLDPAYLSRILRDFKAKGLLETAPSPADGRQQLLRLSERGHKVFAPLNQASREEVAAVLAPLSDAEQRQLVEAMRTIERLLGDAPGQPEPFLLRSPKVGDIGWVIHRQAFLYAQEYGWDAQFEALVAEIAARFLQNFDSKHERCWIAEREGRIVGSVFLVKESMEEAKLRLLYVDREARGLGIGQRLVDECIRFARLSGYGRLTLWTNDVLISARRIYEAAGFRLVREEPHHSFGHDLVGQYWELAL